MRRCRRFVLVLALAFTACGGGGGGGGDATPPEPVPEFQLLDVNPASATGGNEVSPRDLLGSVSAWYFAHAT